MTNKQFPIFLITAALLGWVLGWILIPWMVKKSVEITKPKQTIEEAVHDLKSAADFRGATRWKLDDDGATEHRMYCALATTEAGDYYVSCKFDPVDAAETCARALREGKPYSHANKTIAGEGY